MAGAAFKTAFRHLRDLFGAGSVAGLGDGALLGRYAGSKDPVAFEALVGRHGPMVWATCRAVLRNEQDAEDAFQATFLVLARKAGTVRGGEALGGWLHRVAYRASVEASVAARRRRRKEAEAAIMGPSDRLGPDPALDFDIRPVLHQEIDRLPEGQRLPVVLCDLEGLTYEQAAERLGWTVPTVRTRLAKARRRLKGRLIRRDVTVAAVAAALVPVAVAAAVPAALIRSTVLAATGGTATAGAALLTRTLLEGMLMTKLKFAATAALAAVSLASAGLIAAGAGRPDDPQPASKPQAGASPAPAAGAEPKSKAPTVELKGRIIAPDGRAVVGAAVRATSFEIDPEEFSSATSGPDGRFAIRLPIPPGGVPTGGFKATMPWLVASAPGFGVGWTTGVLGGDPAAVRVVQLAEEGPPIEGRVVDLEGRAVADARVEVSRVWFEGKGDLAGWIAKARNGAAGNLWQGLENLPLEANDYPATPVRATAAPRFITIATSTGADGRFRLTGVGRDRVADLLVSAPSIATTQVYAFSRAEAEVRTMDKGMIKREPFIVHAPRFEVALPPTRRVEGVVRDKDTGRPIAGLGIKAAVFDERSLIWTPGIGGVTDAEGRYRVDGLPRAAAYRLFIKSPKGLPYTNATFRAPAGSPGTGPVAFDFAMKRGVLVKGRVTDKATGKPVSGTANYYALSSNPQLRDHPGFRQSYEQYAPCDEDGRYEVVALAGPGVIAIRDELDRYLPATGFEKFPGYDAKNSSLDTSPHMIIPGSQAAVALVNPDDKAESLALDLQVDPGRTVPIEVVGPDGAPVGDTKVKGLRELFQSGPIPQPSATFEVYALSPGKPRRVIVMQEARKLIGSALLRDDVAGPVTIKLEPWGSVSGRIVDDEGVPRKSMFIGSPGGSDNKRPETHDVLPGSDWNQGIRVGDDGRFAVEGLIPGMKYDAEARPAMQAGGTLFRDVIVGPGEAKDLGDLKAQPPKKAD